MLTTRPPKPSCSYVCIYVCVYIRVCVYGCMCRSATIEPARCTDCRSPLSVVFNVNSATLYMVFGHDVPQFRKELVLQSWVAVWLYIGVERCCSEAGQPQCSRCIQTVPSPPFPSQIPHWLLWARTRVAVMEVRRLTVRDMGRPVWSPKSSKWCVEVSNSQRKRPSLLQRPTCLRVLWDTYIHYWKSSEFCIVRTRVTYSYHLDLKDGVIHIDCTVLL